MDISPSTDPAAVIALDNLRRRYADIVTRRAWSDMPDLFTDDCPIHLDLRGHELHFTGGTAIASFIDSAIANFDFFVLSILNLTAEAAGPDLAVGRMYICELRHEPASGTFSQAFGLYRDDFVRNDGRWRFARRRYSSLGRFDGSAFTAFDVPDH